MGRINEAVKKLIDWLLGPGGSYLIKVILRDTFTLMCCVIILLVFYRFLESVVPSEHTRLLVFFGFAHEGSIYIGVLAIIVRWVKRLYKWIREE